MDRPGYSSSAVTPTILQAPAAPPPLVPLILSILPSPDSSPPNSALPPLAFRYTVELLCDVLITMGCKSRHAYKISKRVFKHFDAQRFRVERRDSTSNVRIDSGPDSEPEACPAPAPSPFNLTPPSSGPVGSSPISRPDSTLNMTLSSPSPCLSSGRPSSGAPSASPVLYSVTRRDFEAVVERKLAEFRYLYPEVLQDFHLACQLAEGSRHVIVLLCGTSGTGKSTLASLLASRLGVRSIVSTDSIRHALRSCCDDPILHASTYSAAEAVAARERRHGASSTAASDPAPLAASGEEEAKRSTVQGFKMQCELLREHIEALVDSCDRRRTSLVIEGVHLTPKLISRLAQRHPFAVVPFVVGISNHDKHRDRFSVRSKYMATDPTRNRYVAHFDAIRTIQEYLQRRAQKILVPWIENTNVDRSVATAHATVFASIRRAARGQPLWDECTQSASPISELWDEQTGQGAGWSSKQAMQLIRVRRLEKLAAREGSIGKNHPPSSGAPARLASISAATSAAAVVVSSAASRALSIEHRSLRVAPKANGGSPGRVLVRAISEDVPAVTVRGEKERKLSAAMVAGSDRAGLRTPRVASPALRLASDADWEREGSSDVHPELEEHLRRAIAHAEDSSKPGGRSSSGWRFGAQALPAGVPHPVVGVGPSAVSPAQLVAQQELIRRTGSGLHATGSGAGGYFSLGSAVEVSPDASGPESDAAEAETGNG